MMQYLPDDDALCNTRRHSSTPSGYAEECCWPFRRQYRWNRWPTDSAPELAGQLALPGNRHSSVENRRCPCPSRSSGPGPSVSSELRCNAWRRVNLHQPIQSYPGHPPTDIASKMPGSCGQWCHKPQSLHEDGIYRSHLRPHVLTCGRVC